MLLGMPIDFREGSIKPPEQRIDLGQLSHSQRRTWSAHRCASDSSAKAFHVLARRSPQKPCPRPQAP